MYWFCNSESYCRYYHLLYCTILEFAELMSGALSDLPEVQVGSEFSLRCSVRNAGAMTEMRWLKRLETDVKAAAAKDVVKLDDGRLYKVSLDDYRIHHNVLIEIVFICSCCSRRKT